MRSVRTMNSKARNGANSVKRSRMRQESKYVNRRWGLVLIPLYVALLMEFFWVVYSF